MFCGTFCSWHLQVLGLFGCTLLLWAALYVVVASGKWFAVLAPTPSEHMLHVGCMLAFSMSNVHTGLVVGDSMFGSYVM